ncbi:MAG: hypothetical protein EP344_13970 [Bacteroidetes bacterium]|nr:MAG: hypothetical protein EP344_13970 [Bacteroidota bacterium]
MQFDKRLINFFLWLASAIVASYFLPEFVKTPFYIFMLIRYFQSKDEAMWFTFFLVFSDGFWGFFNNYEIVLSVIPGLPPIEIAHFYIALALVKASKNGPLPQPLFIRSFYVTLLIYLVFLIAQGQLLGLNPALNVQFRMIKFIFPLTLLYSIPRLFRTEEEYYGIFKYMFPLAFAALFAQVFTITTGQTPSQFLGVQRDFWFTVDVSKGKTYRGFYSTLVVLMTFFGAMHLLANKNKTYNTVYMFAVLAADLMVAILSATRGWLLGLGMGLIFFLLFVLRLPTKQVVRIGGATVALIVGLMMIPVVNQQLTNAMLRFTTLEKLAHGDVSAGGTLERLDKRSPRVMNKWSETPLTGWGFSDTFFEYHDFHVGNQTILLHSGIIGAILMAGFFIFFHVKLILLSVGLPRGHPAKQALLVFPVFFPGWFLIHSTSGQQFAYYLNPGNALFTAAYFGLGALVFQSAFKKQPKEPYHQFKNTVDQPQTPTLTQ